MVRVSVRDVLRLVRCWGLCNIGVMVRISGRVVVVVSVTVRVNATETQTKTKHMFSANSSHVL